MAALRVHLAWLAPGCVEATVEHFQLFGEAETTRPTTADAGLAQTFSTTSCAQSGPALAAVNVWRLAELDSYVRFRSI
ncbi:MAG TPA: hypothetical protein VHI54_05840 [Actinomycetota bacterium]|nr:hypothetical protein [Actinomycetota bacterium]